MTRDIVDGFGPSGTEGVFRSSAEATMNVLRENSGALLTILSAVVSDPLCKWSVNPVKAQQRRYDEDDKMFIGANNDGQYSEEQNYDSMARENQNDAATRAISKISQNLQGYENGTAGERHNVMGQVQLLINSAHDPDNICALFVGWCLWL